MWCIFLVSTVFAPVLEIEKNSAVFWFRNAPFDQKLEDNHRLQKLASPPTSLCWTFKRVQKSWAILAFNLMAFRRWISIGKLISKKMFLHLMFVVVVFFLVSSSWSRVYAITLRMFLRLETVIGPSTELKKYLDIFWPRLERKRFEEYLVILLVVERKL